MYGTTETSAGGSMLAATGLASGYMLLTAVGLVFLGIALVALLRRQSANRP